MECLLFAKAFLDASTCHLFKYKYNMVVISNNYNHKILLSVFFLLIKECLSLSKRVLVVLCSYQLSVLVAFFMLFRRVTLLLLLEGR
jgi:hypothetical protein